MKILNYTTCIVFLVSLIYLSVSAPNAVAAQRNLVGNGSFEDFDDQTSVSQQWLPGNNYTATTVNAYSRNRKGNAQEGIYCLVLTGTASDTAVFVTQASSRIPVKAGEHYKFSFWVRGSGPGQVYLQEYAAGSLPQSVRVGGDLSGGSAFIKHTLDYVVPPGVEALGVILQSKGRVAYDNISLTHVSNSPKVVNAVDFVHNGSFEAFDDSGDAAMGWVPINSFATQAGVMERVRGGAADGSYYFVLNGSETNTARMGPHITKRIPVQQGETYDLSYWVRSVGTGRLYVTEFGASGFLSSESFTPLLDPVSAWTEFNHTYVVPAGVSAIAVTIVAKGRFGVDNISLKRLPVAPNILSNGKTQLEFYPSSMGGGIRQITDLGSGFEFVNGGATGELWSITMVKSDIAPGLPVWAGGSVDVAVADGVEDSLGEQTALVISSADLTNGVVSTINNGLRFSWTDVDVGSELSVLDVTIDVVLAPGDDFARFTAGFTNRSDAHTVFYLIAPTVNGIYPADGDTESDRLATPLYMGRLVYNPIENGIPTGGGMSDTSFQANRAGHSMQFDAYYHNERGLYLGAFDGDQNAVRYLMESGGQSGLAWGMVHVPNNMRSEPQVWTTPYDTVLRCFDGDWYDACRIYREWADDQRWTSLGKVVDRTDMPIWFKEMDEWMIWNEDGAVRRTTRDAVYDLFSDFNIGTWTLGWGKEHFIGKNTPDRFPLDQQSTDFIQRQDDAGWPMMPYIQSIIWDRRSPQFTANDGIDNLVKDISGQNQWMALGAEEWGDLDAALASPTAKWKTSLGDTIKLMAEAGYQSAYLDSANWGGTFLNFNSILGTDVGGGNDYIANHQQMLREIKLAAREFEPGFVFTSESFWEGNIDVIDAQLSVNTTTRFVEQDLVEAIPMLSSVYHDYALFFGVWVSRHDLINDGGQSYIAKFAQQFVWGGKSGWNQHDMLLPAPHATTLLNQPRALSSSLKRYAAYAAARKFLTYGEMLRPPEIIAGGSEVKDISWYIGWTTRYNPVTMPSVLTSYWRAVDGTHGLVLYNITGITQTVTVLLNESEYGINGGYSSATRIYPTPSAPQSKSSVGGNTQITVTIQPDAPYIIELVD